MKQLNQTSELADDDIETPVDGFQFDFSRYVMPQSNLALAQIQPAPPVPQAADDFEHM